MNLINSEKKYQLTLDEVTKLIADNLDVDVKNVSVEFVIEEVGGDPLDRYPGTDTVTKLIVTVKDV